MDCEAAHHFQIDSCLGPELKRPRVVALRDGVWQSKHRKDSVPSAQLYSRMKGYDSKEN